MTRELSKPPANARAKWGVVALLGLALVYVATRPGGQAPPAAASNPTAPAGKSLQVAPDSLKPAATQPLQPAAVEAVVSYNPFEYDGRIVDPHRPAPAATSHLANRPVIAARPKSLPDSRKTLRESMTGKVADVIFESPRGRSARIGNRIVREGRPFDRGVVVRRIQPDNVLLEAAPARQVRGGQ